MSWLTAAMDGERRALNCWSSPRCGATQMCSSCSVQHHAPDQVAGYQPQQAQQPHQVAQLPGRLSMFMGSHSLHCYHFTVWSTKRMRVADS